MTRRLILLVEDNALNQDMLRRRLERRGFTVLVAGDGRTAVSVARETTPAVILMDMNLPIMDGWEASRALKADPSTARVPIIALTSHAMSDDRQRALEAGCDEYEAKPIDFERLLKKIEALSASVPTPPSG